MKKIALFAAVSSFALALAACGGSDDASEDAMADNVELPADEAMADAPMPAADATEAAEDAAEDAATTAATAEEAGAAAEEAAADAAAAAEAATEAAEYAKCASLLLGPRRCCWRAAAPTTPIRARAE